HVNVETQGDERRDAQEHAEMDEEAATARHAEAQKPERQDGGADHERRARGNRWLVESEAPAEALAKPAVPPADMHGQVERDRAAGVAAGAGPPVTRREGRRGGPRERHGAEGRRRERPEASRRRNLQEEPVERERREQGVDVASPPDGGGRAENRGRGEED